MLRTPNGNEQKGCSNLTHSGTLTCLPRTLLALSPTHSLSLSLNHALSLACKIWGNISVELKIAKNSLNLAARASHFVCLVRLVLVFVLVLVLVMLHSCRWLASLLGSLSHCVNAGTFEFAAAAAAASVSVSVECATCTDTARSSATNTQRNAT